MRFQFTVMFSSVLTSCSNKAKSASKRKHLFRAHVKRIMNSESKGGGRYITNFYAFCKFVSSLSNPRGRISKYRLYWKIYLISHHLTKAKC